MCVKQAERSAFFLDGKAEGKGLDPSAELGVIPLFGRDDTLVGS